MQVRLESFLPMVSLYFTNLQVVIHQEMQQCTISGFSLLANYSTTFSITVGFTNWTGVTMCIILCD